MATITQILQELSTKEALTSTANIASALKSTKESILKQLAREKEKGTIDGNNEEGWAITDSGRKVLEKGGPQVTMVGEGVTPREKFESIGRQIGINEDRITLATDIVWSQSYEDLSWVWEALGQADIRDDLRKIWTNSWRAHLKKGIPPDLESELTGTPTAKAGAAAKAGEHAAGEAAGAKATRDYIIVDDMPVRVGSNLGDFTLEDAKDICGMRAVRARFAGTGSGGGQQWSIQDVISLVDKVREKGGNGDGPKTYVVQYTEQGAVLKEAAPGEPIVLSPLPGSKTAKTVVVHPDGTTEQVEPGHPIVIKQAANPPPTQKTIVVRQTDKGLVTEEYEAGKPIILERSAPSGGGIPMLPFPVFGADGKPVLDSEGRPVYANLEPTLKWLGFQAEQRRADQRHGALMSLAQTVKDNLGDGIAALKAAAEEAKRSGTSKEAAPPQPQVYECGQCHTRFTIPSTEFAEIGCPTCKHVYTKQEILG